MRLLAEYPQIVAYKHHPYELRITKYWMHMLKVLAEPANHHQSANFNNFHANEWYVGHNPFNTRPVIDRPEIGYWFGHTHVEQLVGFCQQSIEDFYHQVANTQHEIKPMYFAEKHVPDHIPWLIWQLYPHAREVFLVRDFRDMLCSMLAFNARRGYMAFGRDRVESDEEHVRLLQSHVVSLLKAWQRRSTQAHLLHYEDLIIRPVETLSDLLEYLNLDATSSTIEEMIQRASKDTPTQHLHRTSPSPETSIGRWRQDLDHSLQVACQEAFGDVLKEFGYKE